MKSQLKIPKLVFCIMLAGIFFSIPVNSDAGIFVRINSPAVYINGPDTTTFTLNCGDTKLLPPGGTLSFYVMGWANDILDWTYLCIDSLPEGATFTCASGWSVTSLFTWTPPVAFTGHLRFTNQGAVPCDLYFDEALPVELTSFTSAVSGNCVTLDWQTATESNNSGFTVERMKLNNVNSRDWVRAGAVAGSGTTVNATSYTFKDRISAEGIYKYRLMQTDYNGNSKYYYLSNDVQIGAPARFELSQNYPNPFNPSTVINYNLAKSGNVSLKVYSTSGTEVRTLADGYKSAEYYSVTFDGRDLSSGVYYYKIVAGDFVAVKRMLLLK